MKDTLRRTHPLLFVLCTAWIGQVWMFVATYSFYLLVLMGLVASTGLLLLGKVKISLVTLSVVLLLGVIGLLEIFPVSISLGGGFGEDVVEFEMISFLLLLILVYSYRSEFAKIWNGGTVKTGEIVNSEQSYFLKKFQDKTDHELVKIVNDDSFYSEHARVAARRILSERER